MSVVRIIFWELKHLFNHPRRHYGALNFLYKMPILALILFYLIISLIIALVFATVYDIFYAGDVVYRPCKIDFFHKFYFSTMTQISPGFTEFLPKNDSSRILSSFQSIIGLIINAFFLSLLFLRAVHPYNLFEISSFILFSPKKNKFIFRFYSKFPEPIHNISIKLYRFYIYDNELGEQLGKSEEIQIIPNFRKVLKPNYGILASVDVGKTSRIWEHTIKSSSARSKIPWNWFSLTKKKEGHFYLVISGETSAGATHQVCDFYFNKYDMRCGEHVLLNHGKRLTIDDWYDFRGYQWKQWGKIAPPSCNQCQIPKCGMPFKNKVEKYESNGKNK